MGVDTAMWALCAVSGLTLAVHAWTLKRWTRGWKQAAKATARDDAPTQADFGIVIPCRNEEDRLPHLLDDLVVALRDQPALSQIQVVVVDDWSEDATASLARRHALQPHVVSMQALSSHAQRGGKKAALLAGLEAPPHHLGRDPGRRRASPTRMGRSVAALPGEPTRALRRGGGPRSTLGWPKHGDVWSGFGFGLRRTNGLVGRPNRTRPTRLGLWGQPRGPAICLPGHAPPRSVWRRRLGLANAVQRRMACRMDGRPSRHRLHTCALQPGAKPCNNNCAGPAKPGITSPT